MFYLFFLIDGGAVPQPPAKIRLTLHYNLCKTSQFLWISHHCTECMFANMEQKATQHPTTTITVELPRWVVAILKVGAVRFSKTEEEVMQEAATAYARGVWSLLSNEEKQQNRWESDTV